MTEKRFIKIYVVLFILFLTIISAILFQPTINFFDKSSTKKALAIHSFESFNQYQEIKPTFNSNSATNVIGTTDNDGQLYNEKGEELFFVCKSNFCQINYPFSSSIKLEKVSLLLTGVWQKKEKDISFKAEGQPINSKSYRKNCDYRNSLCHYYFIKPLTADNYTLEIKNAEKSHYGISEIKFYQASDKNLFESLFDFVFIWPRNFWLYLLYPLLFFSIYLLPGILISASFKKNASSILSVLILSTSILWAIALVSYFLPSTLLKFLVFAGFLILSLRLLKRESLTINFFIRNKIILLIYLLSLILISLIMYLKDYPQSGNTNQVYDFYYLSNIRKVPVPYGSYQTDFLLPYQTAINLSIGGQLLKEKVGTIYNITDRTPLISLISIAYAKIFGFNVFFYQMLIIVLGNLFIISTFYLAKIYFSSLKSYLIAIIVSASNFFIFITLFNPAKTATLFFILLSAFCLLKERRNFLYAGILMAVAYLYHPFALIYFFSYLLYLIAFLWRKKIVLIKVAAYFVIPTVTAIIFWSIFSLFLNQTNPIFRSFFLEKYHQEAFRSIGEGSNKPSTGIRKVVLEKDFWLNKVYNLYGAFVFFTPKNSEQRIFNYSKTTIPGALGYVISVFILAKVFTLLFQSAKKSQLKTGAFFSLFIFFILLPILTTVAALGFFSRMGIMWYLLGVLPFILIIFFALFSEKNLIIITFFSLIENIYLILKEQFNF